MADHQPTTSHSVVEQLILPAVRDLGDGFEVRRALPSAKRRMVGPFIFLDHFGPLSFGPQQGMEVRPHPHIGLSTLSYLRRGEIVHRDSLGSEQVIRAGDVNWMTAGRGIVHSERSPKAQQTAGGELFGQQIWVALPKQQEETAPSFHHHPADSLPTLQQDGVTITVVAGLAYGLRSPVQTYSDLMCLNMAVDAGARVKLPAEYSERAILVVSGTLRVEGEDTDYGVGQLVVLKPDCEIVLRSARPTELLLIGGEPLAERRYIEWNFVSSSRERIEQAKDDWRNGRFAGIQGETDFIPLPEPGK